MDEAAALKLFDRCSNVGRWGPDDERGTANHINAATVARATALAASGRVVSLGIDLTPPDPADPKAPFHHRMVQTAGDDTLYCTDVVEIAPHGYACTHLDALGHSYFEGRMWNGRRAADHVSGSGMAFGSIGAFREGLITRGVLLDVAGVLGVRNVHPGYEVTPYDLDRAEQRAGTRVGKGDAVVVRVGTAWTDPIGGFGGDPSIRAGLGPDCIPWLFDRDIAVYSGDCCELQPSGFDRVPFPLHQVGMVSMGLVTLDNVAVEELAEVCSSLARWEFLFVCAPLRMPGVTGCAVNPLAVF